MRQQLLCGCLMLLVMTTGCSGKKEEETTQKLIDYGTGKTQVDTYQQLKKQIKTIKEDESKQFNDATKEQR